MPIYGFKPNPKQLVESKAKRLFGRDAKVKVLGSRPSPLECKSLAIPQGHYYVECFVNGQAAGTAHLKDWRKAYGLLVIEVEKAYEQFIMNVSAPAKPGE